MIRLKTRAKWKEMDFSPLGYGKAYYWGDVHVLMCQEEGLWHMSISLPYRYPTWDEIYTAWHDLCPDAQAITGAILLPRKSEYVNTHPNCFHVHQLEDKEISAGVIL
jgi:hypothetical protein